MENILFDLVKEAHKQIQKYTLFLCVIAFLTNYASRGEGTTSLFDINIDNQIILLIGMVTYSAISLLIALLINNLNFLMQKIKSENEKLYEITKKYPSIVTHKGMLLLTLSIINLLFIFTLVFLLENNFVYYSVVYITVIILSFLFAYLVSYQPSMRFFSKKKSKGK